MTLPVPKSSELPDPDSEAAERRPDLDGLLLLLEVANPGFLHGMEDALEAAHPDGPQAYGRPLSGRRPRKGGLWTWTPENGSQERREQKARTLIIGSINLFLQQPLRKLFKNPCSQAELNKIVPFGFSLQRQKMVFFLPSK